MSRLLLILALLLCNFTFATDPNIFDPPPNPSKPDYYDEDHLPIVFVNNTGLDPDEINIVFLGKDFTVPASQVFVEFQTQGEFNCVGERVIANDTLNGSDFSKKLSEFQQIGSEGAYVAYLPYIQSGIIYFSYFDVLDIPVSAGTNDIVQPSPTNTGLSNYDIIFDIFEFNFDENASGEIFTNATAVSFHSLPIYAYLSTPNVNSLSNTGLYQPRDYIFSCVEELFSTIPPQVVSQTQWNNLFLVDGAKNLRIMSPGKAMAEVPPIMDDQYLDNFAAYGFSFLEDIWTGAGSFYRTNPLQLKILDGSFELYTGVINGDNSITFTSSPSGYTVGFDAPDSTTTFNIFSGVDMSTTDTSPGSTDGVQVSKLFQEAFIAGFLPTTSIIDENSFSDTNLYYQLNLNLPVAGQNSGPWYDLYSKALHNIGAIYTFAFDEVLWPEVQIVSDSFIPNETYLGITLGPFTSNPTNTTLTSSNNPSDSGENVTFTATVEEQGTISETPTGSVEFYQDEVLIDTVPLDGSGQAQTTTSFTSPPNAYFLQAKYISDDINKFNNSESAILTQTISNETKTGTTTEIISSDPPNFTSSPGQEVTFTAEVKSNTNVGIPTGQVAFFVDTDLISPLAPLSGGKASFSYTFSDAGTYTIRAVYLGSTSFLASLSDPQPQTVVEASKHPTSTSITPSRKFAFPGENVTFTAEVVPDPEDPSLPALTGQVIFIVDGSLEGPFNLANGKYSYTTSFAEKGEYTVYAAYLGNDSYRVSASKTSELIIDQFFPPQNASGKQGKNKFPSQKELVNRLRWFAPTVGQPPASYKIYRDRELTDFVANVNGSSVKNYRFEYFDRRRLPNRTYNYYIVSISSTNQVSFITEVTVEPIN